MSSDFTKRATQPGVKIGIKVATATDFEHPSHIGPYKVESLLDKGGMGYLYLALHPETHDPLVVKVLLPKYVGHPEMKERFLREAEVIGLADHPNIVKLYGQGEWEGGLYIAMEFIQGISLRQLILQHSFSLKRAIETAIHIAEALDHLHAHEVIHRDLKPENVLMTSQGGIKVIDFGIAQVQAEQESATPIGMIGTPVYMPPEQRDNPLNATAAADIYALGIIVYELILGRLSHGKVHVNLVPRGFQPILAKMLHPDAAQRYTSMSPVLAALKEYLDSEMIGRDQRGRGYEEDLTIHLRKAQETILPSSVPHWHNIEVGLANNPGLSVSGVYYDFFDLGQGKYGIVMSEPSAQGVTGIVHTAMLQGIFLSLSESLLDPDTLIKRVNKLVVDHTVDEIFTLSYLILDTMARTLQYISCGYGPLWLIRSGTTKPTEVSSRNIGLGIDDEATFLSTTQNWNVGDTLIMNTLRATGTEDLFQQALVETALTPPQKQADGILRKVLGAIPDEPSRRPTTILAVRRTS